jgi:hypothetical protein
MERWNLRRSAFVAAVDTDGKLNKRKVVNKDTKILIRYALNFLQPFIDLNPSELVEIKILRFDIV